MSNAAPRRRKTKLPAVIPAGDAVAATATAEATRRRGRKKSRPAANTAAFVLAAAEAVSAVFGLALAAQVDDGDLREAALTAIEKIIAASPAELQSELRDIVAEAVPPEDIDDFDDLLEIVDDAIRDERKLRIGYFDQAGEKSVRTIKPLAWAESKSGESIAAWCELRRGFRNFRVDRIDGIAALDSYFKGERDTLLDRYLEGGGG